EDGLRWGSRCWRTGTLHLNIRLQLRTGMQDGSVGFGLACGGDWIGRRLAKFLIAVLELVELPVEAALREELLVGAALAQRAFVHDENGVSRLDCAQPVCDEDAGAAGDHAGEGEAHTIFRVCV